MTLTSLGSKYLRGVWDMSMGYARRGRNVGEIDAFQRCTVKIAAGEISTLNCSHQITTLP